MARRSRRGSRVGGLAKRRRRSIIATLFVLLALAVVFGSFGWLAITKLLSPFKPGSTQHILVTVPEGSTSKEIAQILTEKKVVRSQAAFLLAMRLVGGGGKIRADRYDLSPGI